jgi:hypothetical protein
MTKNSAMKTTLLPSFPSGLLGAALAAAVLSLSPPGHAQGLPAPARDNIHALFDRHDAVKRTVNLTDTGYTALTESDNAEVAAVLKSHVRQMTERLESGLRVRAWDPAFAEYARHYRDLEHRYEETARGIRAVVTGKTPAAIKAAQAHAAVVSAFVASGWAEHDKAHPVAAASTAGKPAPPAGDSPAGCCRGRGRCCAAK